jgi:prevent-host-death family protein
VQQVSRRETRVLVAEDGKPLAALISAQDLELLDRLQKQRADAWMVFEEIWSRNADRDPEEVERDVAVALAEVRDAERARMNRDPDS